MYKRGFTPERIWKLKPNEIFVFGSNLDGFHDGGAANRAYNKFGAVLGQGVGLQGQSYAIPTMQGGVETIKPYVDEFIEFAIWHPESKFLVTRIGCGVAGFKATDMAPLFRSAIDIENIILPREFVEVIQSHPSTEELKAVRMWKLGAGNSAKRFNGENPMPEKTEIATKNSWKIKPLPDKHKVIPMEVSIPSWAMNIVRYGHIPDAMEDHWFMYCDDTTIRYYRSWTGFCIYVAKYEDDGVECRITELMVNREPEQYRETNNDKDVALFMALLTEEYGGDASEYWNQALNKYNLQNV